MDANIGCASIVFSNSPYEGPPLNRWVGYGDGTDSGAYVALGEAWVKNYDLNTVPWQTGVSGVFNAPGETIPDTITGGHTGTSTGFSENDGGYPNSFAMRMDIIGSGQFWIVGVWHDPAHPGIEYQKACTGTFSVTNRSIISLSIPPDTLTQTDFTSTYIWTADPATVTSLTTFCSNPGNCGAGFNFITPCDKGDPFLEPRHNDVYKHSYHKGAPTNTRLPPYGFFEPFRLMPV